MEYSGHHVHIATAHDILTVHGKILVGEKLVNVVNCELFAKIFFANIHRYAKNIFGVCTCSLFTKFFLANSFYPYGLPKFSPAKFFPCSYGN